MEFKETELDEERWASRAIVTQNLGNDLSTVNCCLIALECDRAISSLTHITWIEVDQMFWGYRASGCKWWSLETQYWMSILSRFVAYDYWVYIGCFDVINMNINWVWTVFSLTHSAIKGVHCNIPPKQIYWLALSQKRSLTPWLPHPNNNREWSVNDLWPCILENPRAEWLHHLIIELSAAFVGQHLCDTIATSPQNDHHRSINDFSHCLEDDASGEWLY